MRGKVIFCQGTYFVSSIIILAARCSARCCGDYEEFGMKLSEDDVCG